MAVIKFIFITILVMWLIKQIVKLLLPILFQKVVNKAQQQAAGGAYQRQRNYQQQKPVGKISVDYIPPKDKEARAADKAGDFIDFEEIK